MLKTLRARFDRDEEGFTLIELMVVVLIIAILIAIAVPTFLGARTKAQARQVQSNLRNGFSAEKTAFTDNQSYVAASTVQSDEPSLTFVDAGDAAEFSTPKHITVRLASTSTSVANGVVCLYAKGADGKYYGMRDVSGGTNAGTTYLQATTTAPTACAHDTAGFSSGF